MPQVVEEKISEILEDVPNDTAGDVSKEIIGKLQNFLIQTNEMKNSESRFKL